MLLKKYPISSIAALSALLFAQSVLAADTLTDALTGGKANMNLLYHYEQVRQPTGLFAAGVPIKTGRDSLFRLRLGYETARFNGFGMMLEAETAKAVGEKNYNSTANGMTTYTTIADPQATEMNQAYLSWVGNNTDVRWGRQRIIIDDTGSGLGNGRFIGNIPWRINEQTFDAIMVVNKTLPDTTVKVGYLTNNNRVFSDDSRNANFFVMGNHHMKSPIFNVSYKGIANHELVGYAYLLNYNTGQIAANGRTPQQNSADTYGVRLKGNVPMSSYKLLYEADFATQRDNSHNTSNYKATYSFLQGGVDVSGHVVKLGYEVLGTDTSATLKPGFVAADQQRAFTTPLATLHAYNGFADMFLTTPSAGLKDTYISYRGTWFGVLFGADVHDFRADKTFGTFTQSKLGSEFDAIIEKTFDKNWKIGLRYMDYNAAATTATSLAAGDTFAGNIDTQKISLWGEFKF